MFEACTAVVSFIVWGFFFALLAPFVPKLRTEKIHQDKALAADSRHQVITAVTKSGQKLFFAVGNDVDAKPRSAFPDRDDFSFWFLANIFLYLGIIDMFQRLVGSASQSEVRVDAQTPSVCRLVVEVGFSVWAYDFLFYWIHRSWHNAYHTSTGNAWWKRLHAAHHNYFENPKEPLSPMSTFQHHFLDAAAQVSINILVQQIPLSFLFSGPRHKLSKALHNILVTYLLVEAHSGFDLPFMSHRIFPCIFGGSVRHQIHHQHGNVFFHQFFMYLDER
jgi:sterol desaturase/sphingolipid hydroxylase (fatty acid hydroxylase superfamily)